MSKKKIAVNNLSSRIARCLYVLLDGAVIDRKNIDTYNIGEWNSSLHSMISEIRNRRFIPVIGMARSDGIYSYWMDPIQIQRFHDPDQRALQEEEMRAEVESNRQGKAIHECLGMIDRLIDQPSCRAYRSSLKCELRQVINSAETLLKDMEPDNPPVSEEDEWEAI